MQSETFLFFLAACGQNCTHTDTKTAQNAILVHYKMPAKCTPFTKTTKLYQWITFKINTHRICLSRKKNST